MAVDYRSVAGGRAVLWLPLSDLRMGFWTTGNFRKNE